jgi:amidase
MAAAAAIAVPAGFGANGLPMGLQIMGPNHGEFELLQLANAYDEATRWVAKHKPPLVT